MITFSRWPDECHLDLEIFVAPGSSTVFPLYIRKWIYPSSIFFLGDRGYESNLLLWRFGRNKCLRASAIFNSSIQVLLAFILIFVCHLSLFIFCFFLNIFTYSFFVPDDFGDKVREIFCIFIVFLSRNLLILSPCIPFSVWSFHNNIRQPLRSYSAISLLHEIVACHIVQDLIIKFYQ